MTSMLEFQVFEEVEPRCGVPCGWKMTVSKANLIVVCMWGCAVWCGECGVGECEVGDCGVWDEVQRCGVLCEVWGVLCRCIVL